MGKRILLGEGVANFGVRVLLGLLAVLLLAGIVAGCGQASDQPKQEANEASGKQVGQEAKKVGSSQGNLDEKVDDLDGKVDNLDEKVGAGQEDLEKKVDHLQKDVDDLQMKLDELLNMAHALERQRQKQ